MSKIFHDLVHILQRYIGPLSVLIVNNAAWAYLFKRSRKKLKIFVNEQHITGLIADADGAATRATHSKDERITWLEVRVSLNVYNPGSSGQVLKNIYFELLEDDPAHGERSVRNTNFIGNVELPPKQLTVVNLATTLPVQQASQRKEVLLHYEEKGAAPATLTLWSQD